MAVNLKYLKPRDQYEHDMIDFEHRVEEFLILPHGTMRTLRMASNATEEGCFKRREWQRLATEYRECEIIGRGGEQDGDFFAGVTNAIAITVACAMLALIVAGFCWPSIVAAWHGMGWGIGR